MIAFFPKKVVSSAPEASEPASSVQPARRQSLHDFRRVKDLQEQLNELRLINLDKDQHIAMLNRELQERDKVIAMLRRRQMTHSILSSEASLRPTSRGAGIAKVPSNSNEPHDTRMRPIFALSMESSASQHASKRPTPAFINYCNENRGVLKMQNPNMSAAEITRVLGENWRALSPSKQKEYLRP